MEKWVAVLESGEYQQCRFDLIAPTPDGTAAQLCVWGVGVAVYCAENGLRMPNPGTFSVDSRERRQEHRALVAYLSAAVDWYDVPFSLKVESDVGEAAIAGLNDSGESFETIAQLIRKKYF